MTHSMLFEYADVQFYGETIIDIYGLLSFLSNSGKAYQIDYAEKSSQQISINLYAIDKGKWILIFCATKDISSNIHI